MSQTIKKPDGSLLAYHQISGRNPGVLFLGGFMSDMMGTKALYLEELCQRLGLSFVRFDYFGHGLSSGKFEEGTIGRWLEDALFVLDKLTEGSQILVGSSMGGWLMILVAQLRAKRIKGLVGIACAPDFIEDFMRLTPEQHLSFEKEGICYIPSQYGDRPYTITKKLVEEGLRHRVLQSPIFIDCPIRFLHGMNDTDVIWQKSVLLSELITSQDVRVTLIKEGDHRLSTPDNLKLLAENIQSILNI